MRQAIAIAWVCASSVGHANDRKPALVNLLVSTPTTIAVSSTVANARIVPDHIADGKLSTAWNSRTGELTGAWVAVRVPAEARVQAIKITAGFAQKDKHGDLFTMNPRITKVRVSRGGVTLVERALDPENRGLQEIPVDVAGGDLEVRVLEVKPGSKPSWKETCISELEVWGTVAKVVKSRPAFRVGGLDAAATLTREQCIRAVFPASRGDRVGPDRTDEPITSVEITPFDDKRVICRLEHKAKDAPDTTTVIALVRRGVRPAVIGEPVTASTLNEDRPEEGGADEGVISLALFPLTKIETAVLVHVAQHKRGPMMEDSETKSTLYRVTAAGLAAVLEFASKVSAGEGDEADRCALRSVTPGKAMPTLVLDCVHRVGSWHDDDPAARGITEKTRTQRFRWKSARFE